MLAVPLCGWHRSTQACQGKIHTLGLRLWFKQNKVNLVRSARDACLLFFSAVRCCPAQPLPCPPRTCSAPTATTSATPGGSRIPTVKHITARHDETIHLRHRNCPLLTTQEDTPRLSSDGNQTSGCRVAMAYLAVEKKPQARRLKRRFWKNQVHGLIIFISNEYVPGH